jgi:hypothetical protein
MAVLKPAGHAAAAAAAAVLPELTAATLMPGPPHLHHPRRRPWHHLNLPNPHQRLARSHHAAIVEAEKKAVTFLKKSDQKTFAPLRAGRRVIGPPSPSLRDPAARRGEVYPRHCERSEAIHLF